MNNFDENNLVEESGSKESLELLNLPKWQRKYEPTLLDDSGKVFTVTPLQFFHYHLHQASEKGSLDAEQLPITVLKRRTQLTTVMALFYDQIERMYPEPMIAQSKIETLLRRIRKSHIEYAMEPKLTADQDLVNNTILDDLNVIQQRISTNLTAMKQRDRNAGNKSNFNNYTIPLLTAGDVASMEYNLRQGLKQNSVSPTMTWVWCKSLIEDVAEKGKVHPEVTAAISRLRTYANEKTQDELSENTLEEFMNVCAFSSSTLAPIPYQMMEIYKINPENEKSLNAQEMLAKAEVCWARHMEFMRSTALANMTVAECMTLWELYGFMARALTFVDDTHIEKLASELFSKGITRKNVSSHSDDIKRMVRATLGDYDRNHSKKGNSEISGGKRKVSWNLDETKRVKLSQEEQSAKNKSRRLNRSEKKRQERTKERNEIPACSVCHKQRGHRFHKYVRGAGKENEVCPKAPKDSEYKKGFEEFLATPAGKHSSMPSE